ncbi:S1-like domain-containing RNA-binding protein [Sporosarcina sp. FSL W7-1349]|uniref:CvfB family protein n=1 Tax=Sporosarcina sp. FSL W7-1349 TaxID=2921561 RepID=UPI0030FA0F03
MKELQPGTMTELEVIAKEGSRWILEGDVQMNASDADETLEVADRVTVFLYVNRRKELSATTQLPRVTIGSYGWARVIRIDAKEGVYVDIGAPVEVLVNKADMPRVRALWPQTDDMLYMTLRTDLGGTLFGRLVTEERALEQIAAAPASLTNANLKARAYRLLPVGSFLLSIPENYRIFIHQSEREKEPRLGEELDVRVIGVREDGTLNGSLLPRKQERLADDSEVILRYLQDSGGQMPFTDKSNPEEIQEMFTMSKGAFKRALGRLMKEGKITQEDGWTTLK